MICINFQIYIDVSFCTESLKNCRLEFFASLNILTRDIFTKSSNNAKQNPGCKKVRGQ